MARLRLAALVSGSGTNLQALIDACAGPGFPAKIVLVVSNRPGVPALARAAKVGIPAEVVDHTTFAGRAAFDAALTARLEAARAELVGLSGFMRLLTDGFVEHWRDRLINI
ncbi:MAG: phosphoribosylglycinamide formyltransferase, partial [Alphaproteobacteria bacterium]